jgi:hypothetical protein
MSSTQAMPFSSLRQYGVTRFQTREKKLPGTESLTLDSSISKFMVLARRQAFSGVGTNVPDATHGLP